MVSGLETFKAYFKDYANQYVLIGGTACDIAFANENIKFRATRDFDMVLIIETMSKEFAEQLWKFIKQGGYRNKTKSNGQAQFYRFDKPKNDLYPKMIELFCRNIIDYFNDIRVTPIHIDDNISSLSAILLDDDYYQTLRNGISLIDDISILKPEYLILFKAKAYLDLKSRKDNGEQVDTLDIKKHKKDILRITVELILKEVYDLPITVKRDIKEFIDSLKEEPYDNESLNLYELTNEDIRNKLISLYDI